MALYRKLAYAGGIWSLLQYGFLLGIGIVMPALLSDIMPILKATQGQSFVFMSSIMNFVMLLGIIGTAMSITVIIGTKKIKLITKTLTIILIIAGIVFIILQLVQYSYMEDIFYMVVESSLYYGAAEAEAKDNFFGKMSESFIIGIIPGILLIGSGILAYRSYRKPKKPIHD